MTETLYMVVGPGKWGRPRVRRVCKKSPDLAPDEVMFNLQVDLPNDLLKPPIVPIRIGQQNILRAQLKVTPV